MELPYNFEPTQGMIYGQTDVIVQKKPIALTFGNFDGVHLGHRYLIEQMKMQADGLPLVVLSFDPHPAYFFNDDKVPRLLALKEDKIKLLMDVGVDVVILISFCKDFAELSADDFCFRWLAKHFSIRHLMVGYDLSYGKNRLGHYEHMQSLLFGKK
jgi:riboflavin kinase/FMN adenylyltransferase